jgi:hypothetical protein
VLPVIPLYIPKIEECIQKFDARLLIVDPLTAYLAIVPRPLWRLREEIIARSVADTWTERVWSGRWTTSSSWRPKSRAPASVVTRRSANAVSSSTG